MFGIAIYTNGDFQIDIGFPWNEDFSRSFTVEAIIPPGIPVLGSGGFYFGKLSSASTKRVPPATNGTFNPVLVFGFGLQMGLGKSIHYGALRAGFSLTVVGILEGVIAKWNPYQLTAGQGNDALVRADDRQVQDAYYFWLRGTVGVIGKLYGTVDFAIVKADVNVEIKLLLQLTYESYVSIAITVIASVSVSVTIKINCGFFKIHIHFSFSMRLKETFTIDNHGTTPWHVEADRVRSVLRAPADHRLRATRMRALEVAARAVAPRRPNWSNLTPPQEPARLSGYLAPALAMARNEWSGNGQDPGDQEPCYVAMPFIESVPPANWVAFVAATAKPDALNTVFLRFNTAMNPTLATDVDNYTVSEGLSVQAAALSIDGTVVTLTLSGDMTLGQTQVTASGDLTDTLGENKLKPPFMQPVTVQADTSFETLCKMVLRWTIASVQDEPVSACEVDGLVVSSTRLAHLSETVLVSTNENPTPIPLEAVDSFLSNQFRLTVQVPPNEDRDVHATYLPMAPALTLHIAEYGDTYSGYDYQFAQYNSINHDGLRNLRTYFDQLAVQVQKEMGRKTLPAGAEADRSLSMASWIMTDYFLLLARQMVQAAREALRDFKYPIQSGQSARDIVSWINTTGELNGNDAYTVFDLFAANKDHGLNAGKNLRIGGGTCEAGGDTFDAIAQKDIFEGVFTGLELAIANASRTNILRSGQKITYKGKPYATQQGDSLDKIATEIFKAALGSFLTNSGVLSQEGLLVQNAELDIPVYAAYQPLASDTLESIAGLPVYGGAFTGTGLATQNAARKVLRPGQKIAYPGKGPYVTQPEDTLNGVAAALDVSLSELLANSGVLSQESLLLPGSVLHVPPFDYPIRNGDSLRSVSARFDFPVESLVYQEKNVSLKDLFVVTAADRPTPYLDVPHLAQFPIAAAVVS